jgi:hypothetical protein
MMEDPIGGGGVLQGEEGVREGDESALRELWECLRDIGQRAKKNGWVAVGVWRLQLVHWQGC